MALTDMISLSLMALTTALSAAACIGIAVRSYRCVYRGDAILFLVAWTSTITYGSALVVPSFWSPETAVSHGCALAVLATIYAALRVRFGWLTLAVVACVGIVGAIAVHLPAGLRYGYRGLGFAELAAAVVLLGNVYDPHPMARVACQRLALWFAAEAAAAAVWELSQPAGYVAERAAVVVYLWAWFGITVQAFSLPRTSRRLRPLDPSHA